MTAAGRSHAAPRGRIAGIAPQAYLASYKVLDADGSGSNEGVLRALDDAVADGMDVINLSLGHFPAPAPEFDTVAHAENASRAGIVVAVAAGNDGPGWNRISSPATAPSAIAVGNSASDCAFARDATIEGHRALCGCCPRCDFASSVSQQSDGQCLYRGPHEPRLFRFAWWQPDWTRYLDPPRRLHIRTKADLTILPLEAMKSQAPAMTITMNAPVTTEPGKKTTGRPTNTQTPFQRTDLNATAPSDTLANIDELNRRAADGFLITGTANNAAASPFSLSPPSATTPGKRRAV